MKLTAEPITGTPFYRPVKSPMRNDGGEKKIKRTREKQYKVFATEDELLLLEN